MSLNPRHIPDGEVKAMIDIRPRVPMSRRADFDRLIYDRKAKMWCSLAIMKDWANRELLTLDEYLRVRWEFDTACYVVERIDTGLRAWIPLMYWRTETDAARNLNSGAIIEILDILRAGDMRRFETPEKYLEYKRAKSAAVRKSLENKHTDMVIGTIDNLSRKSIQQMMEVEKAIASGERIRSYGDDAKFLNRQLDRQKSGEIQGSLLGADQATNPGMAPGRYKRVQI